LSSVFTPLIFEILFNITIKFLELIMNQMKKKASIKTMKASRDCAKTTYRSLHHTLFKINFNHIK
jgi:hypothetical protein